jgi:hypothetical protein
LNKPNFDYRAYDFTEVTDEAYSYQMWGVNQGYFERYDFEFDRKFKTFTATKFSQFGYAEFNGKVYDLTVTKDFLIISCADCTKPQVTFFNKEDGEQIRSYSLPYHELDRYNLSANKFTEWSGLVTVGGRDNVFMVDWASDGNGERLWRDRTIWTLE